MKKNMPNAINKIQWRREFRALEDKIAFTITIEEEGKVVYLNKGYAGVVNIVQSVDEFDPKEMSFVGDTQVFGFGHPCIQMFALDQLRQKLKPIILECGSILAHFTDNKKLKEFMEDVGRKLKGG